MNDKQQPESSANQLPAVVVVVAVAVAVAVAGAELSNLSTIWLLVVKLLSINFNANY